MTKRKFNLGEIIQKLNEGKSATPLGTSPVLPPEKQRPSPLSVRDSDVPPAPADPVKAGDSPAALPEQPDLFRGKRGIPPVQQAQGHSAEPQHRILEAERSYREDKALQASRYNASASAPPPPPQDPGLPADSDSATLKPPAKMPYKAPAVQDDDEEEDEEFDIFKYVGILLRRKYIVLLVVAIATLLSLVKFIKSDTFYIANARLLFRPDNQEIFGEQNMWRHWGDREKVFSTHLELLKSNTVMMMITDNLNGTIAPEAIAAGLSIKQGETDGEKNDIIEITYKNSSAEMARDVLNELCRSYIDYRRDVNAQEVSRLVKKFEYQIDKLEKDLGKKEGDLREFKEINRMVELSNETHLTVSKLGTMEMQLQETQLALLENKERLGALTTQISQQEHDIVQSVTFQDPFKNRISALELELNTLTTEYSAEHFKVKILKQQIDNLKAAAVDSLTKEAASKTLVKNPIRQALLQDLVNVTIEKSALDAKRIAQEQIIEKLNQELIRLPAMEQKFAFLERETTSLLQTLGLLKTRYEEAKIRRDSEESDLKLLELAQTPKTQHSSGKSTNVIVGILIGFLLGIALALLIEYLDQSLKEPAAVEKVLGLPLLGIVPFIEADHALLEEAADLTKNILEPFRALRANLKHIATTHNLQTFIICSAIKGEGKTTLGANLGITFALDGKKVILVDGDLRRSQVHTLFGVEKQLGLSDFLLGTANVDEIIKSTRIPNMSIVTSGERPNNPAELLGTPLFDHLVTELRKKADIIIFDSPALLPVSDTITMAPKMDGVLFIVRTFWTPLKAAKQALNQLERIGSRLYGGILNGASHSGKNYPYYYGYYGYYGYYSYKYSYDEDHKSPLSLRTAGLAIEQKTKELFTGMLFSLPKVFGLVNREAAHLFRKRRFWILCFLLSGIIAGRIVLLNWDNKVPHDAIEYVGVNSSNNDDASVPTTGSIESDMAFTQKPPSASLMRDSKQFDKQDTSGIGAAVRTWFEALAMRDKTAYLNCYDPKSFRFSGGGFSQWEEQAEVLFAETNRYKFNSILSIRNMSKDDNIVQLVIEFSASSAEGDHVSGAAISLTESVRGWLIVAEKPITPAHVPEGDK